MWELWGHFHHFCSRSFPSGDFSKKKGFHKTNTWDRRQAHFGPPLLRTDFPTREAGGQTSLIVENRREDSEDVEMYGSSFLWAWRFSCRKNKESQAPIKLAQPFPALELRAQKLWTLCFFWLPIFPTILRRNCARTTQEVGHGNWTTPFRGQVSRSHSRDGTSQSEVGTKDLLLKGLSFLWKVLRNYSGFFRPLFCGSEIILRNSRQISRGSSLHKTEKKWLTRPRRAHRNKAIGLESRQVLRPWHDIEK